MNYPQQSAQGLASLGRGNDSMLVHMTPKKFKDFKFSYVSWGFFNY
jgi:hypothetical protein